ncbi:LacI family DNA-binding transcriptional regulator [Paenibacillus sp. CGMCC 1.16610]|uniref:LacI family DNA-binding transcriptional regulator n=1 Tax=Paenibacillus anseongense TaxID=2682845 RepID=A0ABW9U0H8_9BACL|nr:MULTISPECIES: LacI family DNA-binding transcriptional regulator [Paenibacillus]MBA2943113.1 LacI family DNA-binding transcriptional regulator [Paenibacillus sp. CGMCC 1.16610]MVQ33609.1 LacI family DNA-binding transcriptional regulator [Paenibacillus anseongense]
MAPKIKDVAQKAGVSVTTVSRVLNGEKYVKDDLKAKVKRAIDELGYAPSHIARSLVRKKTNLIGVIVPDLTSSFYSTILSSIEETASLNDYNLLVCNIIEDTDKELKYLNVFHEMRVDGIIIMHEKLSDEIRNFIHKLDIPIIFSSVRPVDHKFISVIIDDYEAAYDATKYLTELGHERIAFIGGDMRDVTSGQNRYVGYRNALKDQRVRIINDYIRFGDYKTQSGYDMMKELLACEPRPTALFAVSDDMAVGAMNCIHDHQLKVPDDISIIGFDGSQLTELVRPRLSSMEQPIQEMGKITVNTMIDVISNPASSPREDVILKHKLVVRDSCKVYPKER